MACSKGLPFTLHSPLSRPAAERARCGIKNTMEANGNELLHIATEIGSSGNDACPRVGSQGGGKALCLCKSVQPVT